MKCFGVAMIFVMVRSGTVTGRIKTLKHHMNIVTERSSSLQLGKPQARDVIEPSLAFERRRQIALSGSVWKYSETREHCIREADGRVQLKCDGPR